VKERELLEVLGLDGKIILKWVLRKHEDRSVNWVDLAEDRYKY
jgi:hypothetical protein